MNLIKFYVERDGEASARESILMQFEVSLRALLSAQSHATTREYRPRFLEEAILMCEFLGHDVAMQILQSVLQKVSLKVAKMDDKDAARTAPFVKQLQTAVDAVAQNGQHACAALKAIQQHPLDAPKKSDVHKQLVIATADLDRVKELLQSENIPFLLL
jgi:hypothetical protein